MSRCTYGMYVNGVPSDERRCVETQAGREPLPNYCLEHYSLSLRENPALGPQDLRTWAAAHADLDRLVAKYPKNSGQGQVASWVKDTLGEESSTNGIEGTLRFVEEALELAQSLGISSETIARLVLYVYARPVGKPDQEIAGCLVTLYGAASALGVDAHSEFEKEIVRIRQPEVMDRVRRRQQEKRAATVGLKKEM